MDRIKSGLKLWKLQVRCQHTEIQRIVPTGKSYYYKTAVNLPQQKVVEQIEAKFKIKNGFKWVQLEAVNIGAEGTRITMEDKWTFSEDVSVKALPKVLEEVKQLVLSKESEKELKCSTCNIAIQSEDSKGEGYYKLPKLRVKSAKKDELRDSEMALIDEFKVQAGVGPDYKSQVVEFDEMSDMKDMLEVKRALEMKFQCERCKHINNVKDVDVREVESIMAEIPRYKTVVYVCSLLDFPLGIEKEAVKNRSNVIYVVNKADLFYTKNVEGQRLGVKYCQQIIEQYTGQRNAKVFLCCASKGWNIKPLVHEIALEGDVYFVGRANTGKSSIINAILKEFHGKNINRGPGIGSLPGYTRSNRIYNLPNNLRIVDTPGFTNEKGIYKYMVDQHKAVNKYPRVNPNEVKRLYSPIGGKFKKVFNGKSLLTYGGLVYLQPPENAILKVRYMFNRQGPMFEAKYRNMERLLQLNRERPEELGKRFLVTPETAEDLVHFEIPPFVGNLDIVIQDLGVFSFQPTSSPKAVKGSFTIWAPRDIKMIARPSIFKYIYRRKDGTLSDVEEDHIRYLKEVTRPELT